MICLKSLDIIEFSTFDTSISVSVSEPESEKILCLGATRGVHFFLGSWGGPLASSVLGGGVSNCGRGIFILPFGFL